MSLAAQSIVVIGTLVLATTANIVAPAKRTLINSSEFLRRQDLRALPWNDQLVPTAELLILKLGKTYMNQQMNLCINNFQAKMIK